LQATSDVASATQVFCNEFERPSVANMPRRIALANEVFAAYGDNSPSGGFAKNILLKVVLPITAFGIGYWYASKQGWVKPVPGLRWR
jgi:hypothetical protein